MDLRRQRVGLALVALGLVVAAAVALTSPWSVAPTPSGTTPLGGPSPGPAVGTSPDPVDAPAPRSSREPTPGESEERSADPTGQPSPEPTEDSFAGAHPGPDTTGVPPGVSLGRTDSISTSRDGQVIEDLEVHGTIEVRHDDVTIRRVRILGTGPYGIVVPSRLSEDVGGLHIADTEIRGVAGPRSAGLAPYGRWTGRRLDIHGWNDGVKVASNQRIEDSWIHDPYVTATSHNDGIQTSGGHDVVIRGNRIAGQWQTQTSALILQSNFAPVDGYTIEDNLLSGGSYTLYIRDKGTGHGSPTNMTVRNNRWVSDSAAYGPTSLDPGPGWIWEDNRFDDGTPVPLSEGSGR